MAASKFILATILAASMAALVQAGTDAGMSKALETTDQVGRHYYELETKWVQEKKANCAREVSVVENILSQRDQGASLGEILKSNPEDKRYHIRIAAQYWYDEGTARETANGLYRYCMDNGTYWSPLGPFAREKG